MIVLPCRGLHLPLNDPGDCTDTITWPFMVREIAMIVLLCRFLHEPIDESGDCNDTIAWPVNGPGDCNDSITLKGFTSAY